MVTVFQMYVTPKLRIDDRPDCNKNGIIDNCEGPNDCDGNDVPEDCESDCDGDGLIDACDDDDDDDGISDEVTPTTADSSVMTAMRTESLTLQPDRDGDGVIDGRTDD